MTIYKQSIDEEIQLFKESLESVTPEILNRFKWIREHERAIEAENLHLWKIIVNHLEARNCYCCGFYYASIQVIASTIEASFKMIFRESFPNITFKDLKRMGFKKYIEKTHSKKIISTDLKNRLDKFRKIIRNPVTHPQPLRSPWLGLKETGYGQWENVNGQDTISLEDAAKEGLICMLQLSKEYEVWKRNSTLPNSTQSI